MKEKCACLQLPSFIHSWQMGQGFLLLYLLPRIISNMETYDRKFKSTNRWIGGSTLKLSYSIFRALQACFVKTLQFLACTTCLPSPCPPSLKVFASIFHHVSRFSPCYLECWRAANLLATLGSIFGQLISVCQATGIDTNIFRLAQYLEQYLDCVIFGSLLFQWCTIWICDIGFQMLCADKMFSR